ncbi:acyltransferase family protein [Nocardioides sp. WS12]|uniref:acyltransferase family protein n=1 Tax=Nocardioides sp. WS12 TaxID=2486272 RepID=UPI0015FC85FA|nr:acyltransferase family protein [Nocardioides sp. WS12]
MRADSTPDTGARERNHLLDALRGIAVAGVVGYHIWPGALPGGFLGVDVFFVISGYLITVGLSADLGASRARTFQRFWIRRARRILPALFVMMTVTCAAAGVLGAMSAVRLREQVVSGLTFTTNWHQISTGESYFASLNPPIFQHLWSLAIEEQFYLLWPLLLLVLVRLVRSDRHRWMVVAALAVASIVAMAVGYSGAADPSRLYFGTDTHGFSLMLGALTALVRVPVAQFASIQLTSIQLLSIQHPSNRFTVSRPAAVKSSVALALAALLVAFASMSDTGAFAYRGGIAAIAAVTGLLIVVLETVDHQRVARALPLAPLVWLGERSYGLYLWHWPVVVLVAERWAATSGSGLAMRGLVILAISLLLASLSWKYVEKPFLRGIRLAWPERPDRWLVPAMMVTVVMAIGLHAVVDSPSKTVAEHSIEAGEEAILLSQQAEVASNDPGNDPGPVPGSQVPAPVKDVPLGQQITLFGDSVAVASAPALVKDMAGIAIRAKVGAQVWDVVDQVKRLRKAGRLRKYVVIALGANGAAPRGTFPSIVNAAGPGHRFVFVTAHAPRSWVRPYNQSVRAFVAAHPGCALADWRSASRRVSDLSDGIHPGPRGGGIYAAVIRQAVRNLAAQP